MVFSQSDLCPYKRKLGHGRVQREDPVEILREDSHIQAKETETKPASTVISNLASKIVRKLECKHLNVKDLVYFVMAVSNLNMHF